MWRCSWNLRTEMCETVKLVLEEAVCMGWGCECLGNCRRMNCSNQNGSWLRGPWAFLFWYGGKQPELHQERKRPRLGNGWIYGRMREVFSQEWGDIVITVNRLSYRRVTWQNRGWFHGDWAQKFWRQADMLIQVQEKELWVKWADLWILNWGV